MENPLFEYAQHRTAHREGMGHGEAFVVRKGNPEVDTTRPPSEPPHLVAGYRATTMSHCSPSPPSGDVRCLSILRDDSHFSLVQTVSHASHLPVKVAAVDLRESAPPPRALVSTQSHYRHLISVLIVIIKNKNILPVAQYEAQSTSTTPV